MQASYVAVRTLFATAEGLRQAGAGLVVNGFASIATWSTSWSHNCFTFDPAPCQCTWVSSRWWPKPWAPAPTWEIRLEFQTPGFCLAQPQCFWASGQWISGRRIRLYLRLSVCNSDFQINQCFKNTEAGGGIPSAVISVSFTLRFLYYTSSEGDLSTHCHRLCQQAFKTGTVFSKVSQSVALTKRHLKMQVYH